MTDYGAVTSAGMLPSLYNKTLEQKRIAGRLSVSWHLEKDMNHKMEASEYLKKEHHRRYFNVKAHTFSNSITALVNCT